MSLDPQRPRFMKGDKIRASEDQVFLIVEKIGVGRCAFVYHAREVKSKLSFALKVYNSGRRYEGALQRELSVFETLQPLGNQSVVQYFGRFEALGHHCIIMELLDCSMRHIVYKNNKRGLKLWAVQKFAKDMFRGLTLLHSEKLVHADLKPSNIHWSAQHGCFKLIDFGLSFHLSEKDIHQVQSEGYQAPEVQAWNQLKQRRVSQECTAKSSSTHTCHLRNASNDNTAPCLSGRIIRTDQTERKEQLRQDSMERYDGIHNSCRNNQISNVCSSYVECDKPGKPIDVWSLGCLLMEIATGGKFVKDASLLCLGKCVRTSCSTRSLIDTCFVDMMCQQTNDLNTSACYEVLRDLVYRCCDCDPNTRMTSDKALHHPFFQLNLEATNVDCSLFPTPVLLVTNIVDENEIDEHYNDIARKIVNKCQQCGPIVSSSVVRRDKMKGGVLVMFKTAQDCKKAFQLMSGKTFCNRTIVTSYFPIELYPSYCTE